MKHYVGVKVVQAEPCDEPKPSGADPLSQRPPRRGYRVTYPDGYASWSPAEAFEAAYIEMPNVATATGYANKFINEMLAWRSAPPVNQCEAGPSTLDRTTPPGMIGEAQTIRKHALDLAISSFTAHHPPRTEQVVERAAAFEGFINGMVAKPEPDFEEQFERLRKAWHGNSGGIAAPRDNLQTEGLRAAAPSVTESDIEANIVYETSFIAIDAIDDMIQRGRGLRCPPYNARKTLSILTVCIIVMRNGFKSIGASAPLSADNFDVELGRKFAREDAIRKIGPLMGYALLDRLAGDAAKA
jgi:hypothetical protein